jgi:hypothetical protein
VKDWDILGSSGFAGWCKPLRLTRGRAARNARHKAYTELQRQLLPWAAEVAVPDSESWSRKYLFLLGLMRGTAFAGYFREII